MSRQNAYPDHLQVRVPAGVTAAIAKAAARELTSPADFTRRTLIEKLTGVGALKLPRDDGPDDFTPDRGMRRAA